MSRLVLSPIVTRPAAQRQHRVSLVGGVGLGGGPGHYVVTPTQVEVELGFDNRYVYSNLQIWINIGSQSIN